MPSVTNFRLRKMDIPTIHPKEKTVSTRAVPDQVTHKRKSPDELRKGIVAFRLLKSERLFLDERVARTNLSKSEFIRRASLGISIQSIVDTNMVFELKRLGAMLKHLYPKYSNWSTEDKERYWTTMNDLIALSNSLKLKINKSRN